MLALEVARNAAGIVATIANIGSPPSGPSSREYWLAMQLTRSPSRRRLPHCSPRRGGPRDPGARRACGRSHLAEVPPPPARAAGGNSSRGEQSEDGEGHERSGGGDWAERSGRTVAPSAARADRSNDLRDLRLRRAGADHNDPLAASSPAGGRDGPHHARTRRAGRLRLDTSADAWEVAHTRSAKRRPRRRLKPP